MEGILFEIKVTDEAKEFINSIHKNSKDKLLYNIRRIQKGEKNNEIFKKLDKSEIWEFRTLYNHIAYRLFAFWDTEEDKLIIATHGIIKKTQKTPRKEIRKAELIRKTYFESKHNKNGNNEIEFI